MSKKKIYILSTGRTGSTYLSLLIDELAPDLKIEHQERGARLINIYSNLPIETDFYFRILKSLFYLSGRGNPPKSTVDPLLSGALYKMISGDYLDGKVIHLVRNPINFVESFMNWKSQSIRKKVLHYLVPFWNPVPFIHDEKIGYREWLKMEKFEKFCWIWNYKNKRFYSLNSGNDYLLIKFEDITSKDENVRSNTIDTLSSFLGITKVQNGEVFNTKINKSEKKYFPKYQQWTDSMKDCLKKHCNELANELGYKIS